MAINKTGEDFAFSKQELTINNYFTGRVKGNYSTLGSRNQLDLKLSLPSFQLKEVIENIPHIREVIENFPYLRESKVSYFAQKLIQFIIES